MYFHHYNLGLSHKRKLIVHLVILAIVAFDLCVLSHATAADYGFLALALLLELQL